MRRLIPLIFLLASLSPGCDRQKGAPLPPRSGDACREKAADIISFDSDAAARARLNEICAGIPQDAEVAAVTVVNDGDTITLSDGRIVRYTGIDAPEPNHETGKPEPYSAEATEFNKGLLEGKTILLVFDSERTDNYGRSLAYVFARAREGTIFVNAEMALAGYALAKRFPPNVKYAEVFSGLEEFAAAEKRGLWQTTPGGYVASRASMKFHRPTCPYGRQINPANLATFKTRREALESGCIPCGSCKP